MKKYLILLLIITILLCGCAGEIKAPPALDAMPDDYSFDDAVRDGCVVHKDGDISAGESVWREFVKKTESGESATVRIAYCYSPEMDVSEKCSLYLKDLTFDGEKYMLSQYEDGKFIVSEYKYLMRYEGAPRSQTALFSKYIHYVLTDDNTVTWEKIEKNYYSSNTADFIRCAVVYSDLTFKN